MGFLGNLAGDIGNILSGLFKNAFIGFLFVFILGMAYATYVSSFPNSLFLLMIPPIIGFLLWFDSWIMALFLVFLIVYFFR
jgi:hypothetical protein